VAGKEKPYKVYRGGRVRGPARLGGDRKDDGSSKKADRGYDGGRADGAGQPKPKRRRRWGRIVALTLSILLILCLVWVTLGYLAVRRGVKAANERLPQSAYNSLTPGEGSILSTPTNTLILGADVGAHFHGREATGGRSDSIMLLRTDPDDHRLTYLSIPRDLRAEIPGHGADRVNAAYALGGPALAIDTVEKLTGLPVNHVIVVDFATFKDVVDTVGGITINNPTPILSNFECPFKGAAACAKFKGWRFKKGTLHLDGRRALIYSRVRKNSLNPGDSDITRGERQQRVTQALMGKITGFSGFLHMPFWGDDIVKPLATDLSTYELIQLTWVRKRASGSKTLKCHLGGTPASIGGADVIESSEDNALVIAMITGRTAPQRPPAGQIYAPGCFVG
jgi:LCP family protein required for cell wall assembly